MTLKENVLQTWRSRRLSVYLRLCFKKRKQPDRTFNTPYIKDKTGKVDSIKTFLFYLLDKENIYFVLQLIYHNVIIIMILNLI